MGDILIPVMGNGADLDAVTATAGDVLEGMVIVDKNGNPISGTIPRLSDKATIKFTTDNTTPVLLSDQVFVGLNSDGVKRVCLRYTGENGFLKGNTLFGYPASGFGDVKAEHVLKGKKFTSADGLSISGTMIVSSVLSFSVAAYSTSQLVFSWKNPVQASGRPFSGVIIRWKTGSYPTSPTDGTGWMGAGSSSASGATSSVTLGGFTAGTTYYFCIWAYCVCSAGNYTVNNTRVLVSETYLKATGKPTAHGRKVLTASGTFSVPAGVRSLDVFVVGGGGGSFNGDLGQTETHASRGGGGGGYTATKKNIPVVPGTTYQVTIGSGGAVASMGGFTSFGDLLKADGGTSSIGVGTANPPSSGVFLKHKRYGGNGGSGGGRNGWQYDSGSESTQEPGIGGSDGANGGGSKYYPYDGDGYGTDTDGTPPAHYVGKGQNKTTRAFEETNGTLFAGGGGGGCKDREGAVGGAGGGGKGGGNRQAAVAGTANTGGGAGGGAGSSNDRRGAVGGSGICIVRWK